MGHEAPGRLDLTHKPPLLDLRQWQRFCTAYTNHTRWKYYLREEDTCREYFLREKDACHNAGAHNSIATAQWAAWLRWVAVYKLTGDGRGSFITEEG